MQNYCYIDYYWPFSSRQARMDLKHSYLKKIHTTDVEVDYVEVDKCNPVYSAISN